MERLRIIDWVMSQLNKSEIAANEKLPPEERLAKIFGISTTTVRKEITLLREKGIIYTVPGSGNYVSPFWHKNLIITYDIENLIEKSDRKEVFVLSAGFLPTMKRIRKADSSFLFLPNGTKPILVKYYRNNELMGFMVDWHLTGEIKIRTLEDLEKVNKIVKQNKKIGFNKKIHEISWGKIPDELKNLFGENIKETTLIEEWLIKPNRNIYSFRNSYIKPKFLRTYSFAIK